MMLGAILQNGNQRLSSGSKDEDSGGLANLKSFSQTEICSEGGDETHIM